jgi:hypothetical protein
MQNRILQEDTGPVAEFFSVGILFLHIFPSTERDNLESKSKRLRRLERKKEDVTYAEKKTNMKT